MGDQPAGYVIPIAMTQTEDIAFVICVSCAGESGYDQTVYQAMAFGLCEDMPKEESGGKGPPAEGTGPDRSYETYAGYLAYRKSMADLAALVPVSLDNWPVTSEETWQANPIEDENVWNPVSCLQPGKDPRAGDFRKPGQAVGSFPGSLRLPKSPA